MELLNRTVYSFGNNLKRLKRGMRCSLRQLAWKLTVRPAEPAAATRSEETADTRDVDPALISNATDTAVGDVVSSSCLDLLLVSVTVACTHSAI